MREQKRESGRLYFRQSIIGPLARSTLTPLPPCRRRDSRRYLIVHSAASDPALAEQLAIERVRAGSKPRILAELGIPPACLSTPEGSRAPWSGSRTTIKGRLTASQAGAISQLVNSAMRVAELALSARLAALEAAEDDARG